MLLIGGAGSAKEAEPLSVKGSFPSKPARKSDCLCQARIDRGRVGPPRAERPGASEAPDPSGGALRGPDRRGPARSWKNMGSCQPWFDRGARAERRRRVRRAGNRAMEAGPRWRGVEHPAVDRFAQGGTEMPWRGDAGMSEGRGAGERRGREGRGVGGRRLGGHRGAETPEHGWRYRGAGMRASVFLSPSRLFGLFCARREWARMEGEPTGRRGGAAARGEKGRFRPIDPIGWPYGRLRSRRTRRRGRSCRLRRRTKVRGRRRRRNCPWRTNP